MKKLFLFFLNLVLISLHIGIGQTLSIEDLFDLMSEGMDNTIFLSKYDSKLLNEDALDLLQKELTDLNFTKDTKVDITVANNLIPNSNKSLYYTKQNNSSSILIQEFLDEKELNKQWEKISSLIGVFTGTFKYYLKLDSPKNVSLNATFKTGFHIINMRQELSFKNYDVENWTREETDEFIQVNKTLNTQLKLLFKYLVTPKNLMFRPLYSRKLTAEERLYGFILFWTEVKYNFAFFNQVPKLNWDQILFEYLSKIKSDQTNLQYYKSMKEICAKLHDGHTNIYLPRELRRKIIRPTLKFREFDNEIYLTNFDESYKTKLKLGLKLKSVDGIPVDEFLKNNIYPYISSSTEYIKQDIALSGILDGEINTSIPITLEDIDGELITLEVVRKNINSNWVRPFPGWNPFSYKKIDEISIITINSFNDKYVVGEFNKFIDSIKNSKKLILDLRNNGGGNSKFAYQILKNFAKKPFLTSKWRTREHKAAFKAWGASIKGDSKELDKWEIEAKKTFEGDFWYESPPDTIYNDTNNYISIPTVILIGHNTASAAEDFLVSADNMSFGITMGDYTFGSTGQPLYLDLPGGGEARICTKKDMYPDGREFVGYGIKPDIIVKETLESLLNNKDVVLEYAIKYLTNINDPVINKR